MDDARLELLTKALKSNQRLWALNVGENFQITLSGWEKFAEELPETGVTHIYAGSETTVYGDLKVKMREAVRLNRSKHDLHTARDNLQVIVQIGQMWWNPRNSKIVQSYKYTDPGGVVEFGIGSMVLLKSHKLDTKEGYTWLFGRIREVGKDLMREVENVVTHDKHWFNLLEPKLSCSSKHELVFAAREGGLNWPAIHFDEAGVFVFIKKDLTTGKLVFEIDPTEHPTSPFYLDEAELDRIRNRLLRESIPAAHNMYYGPVST